MARERLYLFDTTLRDGAQTNGVDFTLADLAELLGKTPRQLNTALARLIADEYLVLDETHDPDNHVSADRTIYPTTKALRTLPAFRRMKVDDVEMERQCLFAAGS